MQHGAFRRSAAGIAAAIGCVAVVPAQAVAATPTVQCSTPTLSQPFLSWGDGNWYALPSGESADNFTGTGWMLTGGASILLRPRVDGSLGFVLNLPAGATATSPYMCVNSNYPTARTMVRNVIGNASVGLYVSAPGQSHFTELGQLRTSGSSWKLSDSVNLDTSGLNGWQLERFGFAATDGVGDFQIYNFYIDPYSK